MAAVHFYGKDAVLSAFENMELPRWALFSGRQFLFKYEGENLEESALLLEQTLNALTAAGQSDEMATGTTSATMTLKVYEAGGKITEKTVCDGGSFNFKLVTPNVITQRAQLYTDAKNNIAERLNQQDERLQRIEEALTGTEEEEEEPNTLNGILIGLLKEPEKIATMIGAIKTIMGGAKATAAIGNIPPAASSETNDDKKTADALNILKQHDAKLSDHLLKLAGIAQTDPSSFQFLLSILDKK